MIMGVLSYLGAGLFLFSVSSLLPGCVFFFFGLVVSLSMMQCLLQGGVW